MQVSSLYAGMSDNIAQSFSLELVCVITRLIEQYYNKYIQKNPCMNSAQTGNMWVMELLGGHEIRSYRMFRMDKDVFMSLCNDLQCNYGLRGSRNISAFEIVGLFLFILGQGVGNRSTQERFQHSGETISRYFEYVLDIVCRMSMDVIKPDDPEFNGVPQEILVDSRYMPHFKVFSSLIICFRPYLMLSF